MINSRTLATKIIIALTTIVFIFQKIFGDVDFMKYALHGFSFGFKLPQFITYLFLHADAIHLIFNMFALFVFGSGLEAYWGANRFVLFYFTTGIGAALVQYITLGDSLIIGASGSVFGIFTAYGLLFPNNKVMLLFPPVPLKAKYMVLIFAAIEFCLAFGDDKIAHLAHIGGVISALVFLSFTKKDKLHGTTFFK